jgi:hypothetical protein
VVHAVEETAVKFLREEKGPMAKRGIYRVRVLSYSSFTTRVLTKLGVFLIY